MLRHLAVLVLAVASVAPAVGQETKTFIYKKTKQGDLKIVVHYPPAWKDTDQRPGIVFFFGGGWVGGRIEQFEPQAKHLASRGMVAARADYRVKTRHDVSPKECVEDAKSAVRWMRQNAGKLGIDSNRIVAGGGSAGGHIAACTALTPGLDAEGEDAKVSSVPNALVLFNPVLRFSGIPQLMERIGNDEALGKAISPTLHLKKDSPPTLILFGTADQLAIMGDEFMKKSKELGHRAELFTAEGQPHGFFNQSPWLEKTTRRMDEFLASIGYLENPVASNDNGWTSLFNGRNLDGWVIKCRPEDKDKTGYWKVVNGTITAETPHGSKHNYMWLLTQQQYGDFELKLKVQTYSKSTGNSGIQVRSRYDDAAHHLDGPQIDINPPGAWRNGFIYDETRGAQIWLWPDVGSPANAKPSHAPKGRKWFDADKQDVWNEVYIRCQGTKIKSIINGVTIADYDGAGRLDDAAHRKHNVGMEGHIGLQIHPGGEMVVRFKDILVRSLSKGDDN